MSLEQAYIDGFIKRAMEYGVSAANAFDLLKYADDHNSYSGPGGSVFAPRQPLGQSPQAIANAGTQTYAGPGGSVFAPRQSQGPSSRSIINAGTQKLEGPGTSALSALMNANTQSNIASSPKPAQPAMPQSSQPAQSNENTLKRSNGRNRPAGAGTVMLPTALP
jgi:hypothetical protein